MKVSFVGTGRLGSTIAYTTALRGLADEIVMVDILEDLARGQAHDMRHAVAYKAETSIHAAGYEEIRGSHVVVVTAGRPRQPGMSRLDLLATNAPIMREIAQRVADLAPEAVMVNLTNPMDVMNYVAREASGFRRTQVVGSGGMLDTARFRTALADHLSVSATRVEAYVLGEHGDSQVPVWSRVAVEGETQTFSEEERAAIREGIREVAINIISGKGATEYGPANGTADMIEAILRDQEALIPSSIVAKGEYGLKDVSIGMPVVLGAGGVTEILEWDLAPQELEDLQASGRVLEKGRDEALEVLEGER
ncbi:MAG: L-lactate dehydrogenase [Thermoplasmata archaeon]